MSVAALRLQLRSVTWKGRTNNAATHSWVGDPHDGERRISRARSEDDIEGTERLQSVTAVAAEGRYGADGGGTAELAAAEGR